MWKKYKDSENHHHTAIYGGSVGYLWGTRHCTGTGTHRELSRHPRSEPHPRDPPPFSDTALRDGWVWFQTHFVVTPLYLLWDQFSNAMGATWCVGTDQRWEKVNTPGHRPKLMGDWSQWTDTLPRSSRGTTPGGICMAPGGPVEWTPCCPQFWPW